MKSSDKALRHLPVGELLPHASPQHPWSHITMDVITDMPKSSGNTTILVISDRFSSGIRLIPLLPSAFEAAELLFHYVFCHYGIPEDIVSVRGLQFIP